MYNAMQGVPSPLVQFVRSLPLELYTRAEIARVLECSPQTLQVFAGEDPQLGPSYEVSWRGRPLALYTLDDLELIRAHVERKYPIRKNGLRARKKGRPKLWSPEELRARDRQQRRARDLEVKAAGAGPDEAAHYAGEAAAIRARLRREYDERFAYATRPRVCS